MDAKKVLIVSRHSIVRHGLKLMLHAATPHTVVGDDRSLNHIVSMLEAHAPDLVIVDMDNQTDGLDQLRVAFAPAQERAKLLLLWNSPENEGRFWGSPQHDSRFLTAAEVAAAVVTSRGDAMDVLKAVSRIVGDHYAAPVGASDQDSADTSPSSPKGNAHITPREKQIMELIRQGFCNKRIARALEISVTTVRTHRQKLMAKLGLRNAVEIARFAAGAIAADLGVALPQDSRGGYVEYTAEA